jgi:flagellar protein FlgJ
MRSANAVFEEDSLFKSEESNFYRDMHDHQLSLTLAHRGGFGVADALYRQMSRDYGNKKNAESAGADAKVGVQRASVSNTPEEFINLLMPKVKKAGAELGVEPELIIAQAALETGWGSRVIADENGKSSNNLFNIKAGAGWRGESISTRTLEHMDGTFKPVMDEFRRYESLEESIEDYVKFIQSGSRYQEVLDARNGAEYLDKLQRAGYATDPSYADKILSVYEKITGGKQS